jgi:ABC-type transport system substrate-binding protein
MRASGLGAVTVLTALMVVFSSWSVSPSSARGAEAVKSPEPPEPATPLTLSVGQVGEMSTRNLLPGLANTVPTSAVLFRIYDSVLLSHPVTAEPLPYIVKGTDYDEDGLFDLSEYGMFRESGVTTPLTIVLYYDFNGVRWHDGIQVTPWDLFFSYHVNAMNSRFSTNLRVLFCSPGTSYETCNRQLGVAPVTKFWEGEGSMPGDPNLRVAVRHTLNEPFARFYGATIAPVLLPMHLWSRTGGGRHADFGCAIWIPPAEATARGIPECGNTDPLRWGSGIAAFETVIGSSPYAYPQAESWNLQDADVVGHGPFRFVSWTSGVEAQVARNDDFFTGVDAQTSVVLDPRLATVLKAPTTDGILFQPFASADLCGFALNISGVDFCLGNLPPAVIPELRNNTAVAIEVNAESGFTYVGYNMRKGPFGYLLNDSANDVGYWFRQATAHLVDRPFIVGTLLQGLGTVGYGFVSPTSTFWYNDAIPKPQYNATRADEILDSPGAFAAGISPDPPGVCPPDCRSLPEIGQNGLEILTTTVAYDPVRAAAGDMLAQEMRNLGINATARHLDFPNLVANVTGHTFDMYILSWRIGGTDPDYLYSFFHSLNVDFGQNFPGFRNATFDAAMEASRAEMDPPTRRSLIFQAQQILSDARPYEILFYRSNVEGYRQDRWVNWSVQSGTIWNYWSLLGIHPPSAPAGYEITVDTSVPVLQVSVDGFAYGAPYVFSCTTGSSPTIGVPSPQTAGPTRFSFASWSDGGAQFHDIPCDANATYIASFSTEYEMRLTTLPPGLQLEINSIAYTAPYTFWCAFASVNMLNAPSPQIVGASQYVFASWSDGGFQSHSAVCVAPATIEARFDGMHEITIGSVPTALLVQVSGTTFTTPYTFMCAEGQDDPVDALSPQDVAGTRYVFSNWDDGAPASRVITCNIPATYIANYAVGAFEVTVDTAPPALLLEVDGVTHQAPHTFWCATGSTMTLAAPSPQGITGTRSVFSSWSDAGAQTHDVPCDAPSTIVATFTTEYEVTITTAPGSLLVTLDGTDVPAPHAFWCAPGSTHTLSVPSPQTSGTTRWTFVSWSDGGTPSHTVPCDAAATYTATLAREFQITVDTSPSGRTVEVDGVAATAPQTFWCAEDGSRTVSVPSPQGSGGTRDVFSSWSDGGTVSHAILCSVPETYVATLSAEYQVTISTTPDGLLVTVNGNEVSSPHSVWCGAGSSVTVGADSAQTQGSTRYRFASWSDGGEQTHAVSCDAPVAVTATFEVESAPTTRGPPYSTIGGVLLVVAAVLGLAYFLWRRKQRVEPKGPAEPPST